ncbi:MAG: TolC family protein [Gemmatimonadota bacterium]|nr:TolC family protein [Gemmatimonadota bacterium]
MNRGLTALIAGLLFVPLFAAPLKAQESEQIISLESAIQTALSNSQRIQAAEEGLSVAEQQVREAWAGVMPDISADASYSRNLRVQEAFLPAIIFDPGADPDDLVPVRFGADNTWSAGIMARQPLFEYNVFIGLGAAARFRTLQNEVVRGATQEVVSAVRRAYLDVLLAIENERLTVNTVERTRATLEEAKGMERAGLVSEYDVLRLEVQLANVEPNLRRAQNGVLAAKRSLLVEIGLDPTSDVEVDGSLAELDLSDDRINSEANARLMEMVSGFSGGEVPRAQDLYEIALANRTDVRQQQFVIELEQTRLRSQKAEYFPSLSLFSNYNITAQQNGAPNFFGTSNSRSTAAVAGVSVSVPIFRGFSRDARIQQTAAVVRQNSLQLDRIESEVVSQVETVVEAVAEARLRVLSQAGAVEQATRGFEIASAQYREGLQSQLQVTDAENALRMSEFNYSRSVYDYLIAVAQLDGVLGTVPVQTGVAGSELSNRGEQ